MGSHPINLILRFLLEVVALIATGLWGWFQAEGGYRYVLASGIPVLLSVIWGTFAVPHDPSRSGEAPIAVKGIIRLLLEFAFFGFATWAFLDLDMTTLGLVFGGVVILHYLVSYDRIKWLLKN